MKQSNRYGHVQEDESKHVVLDLAGLDGETCHI